MQWQKLKQFLVLNLLSLHFIILFVLFSIQQVIDGVIEMSFFYMCYAYFEVKVQYKMSCCKKNSCFSSMLTLFRCRLITENQHLLRDPELSSVTRNCQIYIMPLETLKIYIQLYFLHSLEIYNINNTYEHEKRSIIKMACTVYTSSNTIDENNGTQLHLQRKKTQQDEHISYIKL